jgi:hypothetical protein
MILPSPAGRRAGDEGLRFDPVVEALGSHLCDAGSVKALTLTLSQRERE